MTGPECVHGPRLRQAIEFLRRFLADGPRLTSEVEDAAHRAGISLRTLDRARAALEVRVLRWDFGGPVFLALPRRAVASPCPLALRSVLPDRQIVATDPLPGESDADHRARHRERCRFFEARERLLRRPLAEVRRAA